VGAGRNPLRNGILLSKRLLFALVGPGDNCVVSPGVARTAFPPLSTDCPEVIGLVNYYSATVLVRTKLLNLSDKIKIMEGSGEGWQDSCE
jgi:hypothetical protein